MPYVCGSGSPGDHWAWTAMPGVGFLRSRTYLRLVWVGVGGEPASQQLGESVGMFHAG